jgi:hypothetical protein
MGISTNLLKLSRKEVYDPFLFCLVIVDETIRRWRRNIPSIAIT